MFILNYGVKLPLAFTIATITNSIPKIVRKTSHFPQINTEFLVFFIKLNCPHKRFGHDIPYFMVQFALFCFNCPVVKYLFIL